MLQAVAAVRLQLSEIHIIFATTIGQNTQLSRLTPIECFKKNRLHRTYLCRSNIEMCRVYRICYSSYFDIRQQQNKDDETDLHLHLGKLTKINGDNWSIQSGRDYSVFKSNIFTQNDYCMTTIAKLGRKAQDVCLMSTKSLKAIKISNDVSQSSFEPVDLLEE